MSPFCTDSIFPSDMLCHFVIVCWVTWVVYVIMVFKLCNVHFMCPIIDISFLYRVVFSYTAAWPVLCAFLSSLFNYVFSLILIIF